ncbi:hypothetical protein EDD85DRAFT_859972 [Armillaria nabsnona]|nr:hypothetical protein EDD85DRAFT_859972 [Armillaria nabsnona]
MKTVRCEYIIWILHLWEYPQAASADSSTLSPLLLLEPPGPTEQTSCDIYGHREGARPSVRSPLCALVSPRQTTIYLF